MVLGYQWRSMATANSGARAIIRTHPRAVTALVTAVGYGLVFGTLAGALPVYPRISPAAVDLLSHAIAAVNTVTVLLLALGWYWIRQGEVRRHRAAMTTAFVLILLFLVLYLLKTGGGGRKDVIGQGAVQSAYLVVLSVHVLLSVLAVPVVVYALSLGLTHTPGELRQHTPHRTVGRLAAGAWSVSLILGITAYVLLNYVLEFEFVRLLLVPF